MSIFDKAPEIKVNMTGREYIEYRKNNRSLFGKPLSKKTKKALPWLMLSAAGILVLVLMFQPEPTRQKTSTEKAFGMMPIVIKMSWSDIGKVIAVVAAPFLIIIIGLAWLIHGFGFLIVKG